MERTVLIAMAGAGALATLWRRLRKVSAHPAPQATPRRPATAPIPFPWWAEERWDDR